MHRLDKVIESAGDEIVFALRNLRRQPVVVPREVESGPKEAVRVPIKSDHGDLEAAIDDMIERFPKTLEHLAK